MATNRFENADIKSIGISRMLIVDNDCGVDDAWGLSLLTTIGNMHQIKGLTCVKGNTDLDNVCNNNLYLLSLLGKTEIPVFRGAQGPLLQINSKILCSDIQYFHGRNGFGDVPLPELKKPKISDENAIVALNRITSENKNQITLVCFGPLTNIALVIRTYPEFVSNVKDVFIMGGNYQAVGNTTSCAEFNFHADPEAANIVLSEMQNKIYLLPWETCLNAQIPYDWRESLKSETPICTFLNTIEKPILERQKKLGYTTYTSADQLLAAILIDPSIVENAFKTHAFVELSGCYTRGLVILDYLKSKQTDFIIVLSKVDSKKYFNLISSIKTI